MSVTPFESEVERQLAENLLQRNIKIVHQFRVPGSRFVFDFILPEPPFGVVEVLGASFQLQSVVTKTRDYSATARRHFGESVRIYLVATRSDFLPPEESLPDGIVLCVSDGDVPAIADQIAEDFLAHKLELPGNHISSQIATVLAEETDELSKTLGSLMLNLDYLFLNENRDVLENEILRLRDEIHHEHYTAAALRVGRSMEFIIYAACKSWDVPVREPVLVGLSKLDDRVQQLKSALLEYATADNQKENQKRARKNFLSQTTELQKTINQILIELDEHTESVPNQKRPINPNALLADIRKRYARLPEVREAIDSQQKSLSKLLQLRNDAAHASLECHAREVERGELQEMIELLNEVLLGLSKCGTAILASRRSEFEDNKS